MVGALTPRTARGDVAARVAEEFAASPRRRLRAGASRGERVRSAIERPFPARAAIARRRRRNSSSLIALATYPATRAPPSRW